MSVEIPDYLPDAVKAEIQTRFTRINEVLPPKYNRLRVLSKEKILKEYVDKHRIEQERLKQQQKEELQAVLRHAVQVGDLELAEEALDRGANINEVDYHRSIDPILFYVTEPNAIDKIEWLVHHGANIQLRSVRYSEGILHKYLLTMSIPNLERLLALGANIQEKDANGDSLLHYVAHFSDDVSLFEFLLRHGIDVNVRGISGEQPLGEAVRNRNYIAVRWLLEHGANVHYQYGPPSHNYINSLNNTYGIIRNTEQILELLLDYGIEFESRINGTPNVVQVTNPLLRRKLQEELARRGRVRNAQRKLPHIEQVETLLEQRPNIPENVGALMASQLTRINHASLAQQRANLEKRINTMTRKPPRRITNSVLGPVNTSLFEGGRRKRKQKKTRRRS